MECAGFALKEARWHPPEYTPESISDLKQMVLEVIVAHRFYCIELGNFVLAIYI